jgi:15,16-dihydrobiliverdin:ferredoxin oxidoreductase
MQVFNAVWYPSYEYDAPILGMDLISLGKNRVVNVIDFQPLLATDAYAAQYIDHLAPIRAKYPDLQGTLSGKIYHDALFFSKQMLFGRMPDESKVKDTVFPAYQEYLSAYLQMMDRSQPDFSPERVAHVRARQSAYDAYNAVKDPAVGLYDAYFGKEWSNGFVHDFLFSNCREGDFSAPSGTAASSTVGGCNVSLGGETHKPSHVAAPVHKFTIDRAGELVLGEGLQMRAAS